MGAYCCNGIMTQTQDDMEPVDEIAPNLDNSRQFQVKYTITKKKMKESAATVTKELLKPLPP